MNWIKCVSKILKPLFHFLDNLQSFGDLLARFYVANVFWKSGLSKIQDWDTTMVLFKDVYSTPLLPAQAAAYIGTGAELFLPVLLLLGLGGRVSIFVFFIYNAMCALSFHFLWTPAGNAGLQDHIMWGLLLMMLMFHGSGKISLDYLIRREYGHHLEKTKK